MMGSDYNTFLSQALAYSNTPRLDKLSEHCCLYLKFIPCQTYVCTLSDGRCELGTADTDDFGKFRYYCIRLTHQWEVHNVPNL